MKIFIPIKHNSQRVPRKNFRLFRGVPLYKHTLLKYSNCDVYVDTDSEEIINEITRDSRLSNVKVYKRSSDLLGDEVSVCDLIKYFITKFKVKGPIAQIHVTSPLLSYKTIERAFAYIGQYDSVVSCNSYNSRFWRKEKYGVCPINHNPLRLEQTQDLPTLYEENSCFYIFDSDVVLSTGNRIGKRPYFYSVSEPENIDIDTEDDWNKLKDYS